MLKRSSGIYLTLRGCAIDFKFFFILSGRAREQNGPKIMLFWRLGENVFTISLLTHFIPLVSFYSSRRKQLLVFLDGVETIECHEMG